MLCRDLRAFSPAIDYQADEILLDLARIPFSAGFFCHVPTLHSLLKKCLPARGRVISTAVNDETFVIDKAVFKAKTYCFGVKEGDRVRFIEGSASGACASAKFLVLSTGNICEVWCE